MTVSTHQTNVVSLEEVRSLYNGLKSSFENGKSPNISHRIALLKKLGDAIEKYSDEITNAAFSDFHKPKAETLLTEIYPVLSDIKHTTGSLKSWARPQSVTTNLLLLPSTSKIFRSPKGVVLIMAPWNYPFYLSMMPLISAIAAGNMVLLKPAHETHMMSLVIKKIVEEVFDKNHVAVILGEGRAIGELVLGNFKFDHIFFTGSSKTGRWIMEQASKNLTPVSLELGGKSPAIIDTSYDLNHAAKKIVWGKYINAGQTCVCPDYVLVHHSVKDKFIEACKKYIIELFGDDVFNSETYCHMIHKSRFDRVVSLMNDSEIIYGGKHDKSKLCIEPTLVIPKSMDGPLMSEEIFGPVLPIVSYENREDIIDIVRKNRYPLSLYAFTENSDFKKFIIDNLEFGGGCINSTVFHLGNPHLPFGGIQTSGMGHYHGKAGFDTFSNVKPVLINRKWFDPSIYYQPYTKKKLGILKWFFKR